MNSAARILAIVEDFCNSGSGKAINDGWKTILKIDPGASSDEEVFAAVQAFLSEIKSTELRLKELGAPDDLFNAQASRLRNVFSPMQLSVSWDGLRDQVSSEAGINALQWAKWMLKKFDENDLDQESLDSLYVALHEQERLLAEATLPVNLREMLNRQVVTLKSALALYKIKGAMPLREAVHKTVGEVISEDKLNTEEIKNATPEVRDIVKKGLLVLTKAAEIADKGSKVAKFAEQMYNWASTGIGNAQGMFPSLPSMASSVSA